MWDTVKNAFDQFFSWLPNLLGAIAIILIAWLVARLIGRLVEAGLRRLGTDRVVETGTVGTYKQRVMPRMSISHLIGRIAFWFVLGIGILLALSALQIPMLGAAVGEVVGYLPNVVAALLFVLVGIALAAGVGTLAHRLAGGTLLGRLVGTAGPTVIMAIAIAMALVQLQLATTIVIATYVIVLGAAGLGLALAFGLGGRHVASTILDRSYQRAQESAPELKAEAQMAAERARSEADRVRHDVEEAPRPLDQPAARRYDEDSDIRGAA